MVLVSGSKNSKVSGESVMLTARHSAKGYNNDIRLYFLKKYKVEYIGIYMRPTDNSTNHGSKRQIDNILLRHEHTYLTL